MDQDLAEMLSAAREDVLGEADVALARARLVHYRSVPPEGTRQRLSDLFDVVRASLSPPSVVPIAAFAERLATARFNEGFDISELQTAFNVMEEALWRLVIANVRPDDIIEAVGLVGTVLGAGKDALARTWVTLAKGAHVASLNLGALSEGVAS
ncbi:MAG TPA: hypothetical protein VFA83_12185 [Acidimicrobiales bacterium]|nr:hypothetical protein [Acidimicrobiales bacterium]